MRMPPYTTLALASATAILMSVAACLTGMPWNLEQQLGQHAAHYALPEALVAAPGAAPINLNTLRTAPLFYRSRQTIDDAELVAAVPPQYVLVAALTGPAGKSVAYVRPVDGKD